MMPNWFKNLRESRINELLIKNELIPLVSKVNTHFSKINFGFPKEGYNIGLLDYGERGRFVNNFPSPSLQEEGEASYY
jgi:hypothetical protein